MTDQLQSETLLRVRVHEFRVAIELTAGRAVSALTQAPPEQNMASARLVVLAHECSAYRWADSYRIVRLARHCYKRASDVLHGRSSMASLSPSVVSEWEQIVQELEALHLEWTICRGLPEVSQPKHLRREGAAPIF